MPRKSPAQQALEEIEKLCLTNIIKDPDCPILVVQDVMDIINESRPAKKAPPASDEREPIPLTLDTEDFRLAWTRWAVYKKECKKKWPASTQRLQLKKLEKMGVVAAIEAIDHSIENSYTGLFQPTHGGKNVSTGTAKQGSRFSAERSYDGFRSHGGRIGREDQADSAHEPPG